jgi:ATP-dependent DNA helicase RecQ
MTHTILIPDTYLHVFFSRSQVPALLGDGLVLVISPLLSLMHDQVSALLARGVEAASTADPSSESAACEGRSRLLYTTPETLLGRLKNKLPDLHRRIGIRLIAIDEAHCVSEWGHDFRPEYQRLAEVRSVLPGVPIMALTATATPRVQAEIVTNLRLGQVGRGGHVSVISTFDRPNLYYSAVERSSEEAEEVLRQLVWQSNSEDSKPSIVYVLTQKEAEKMADKLILMGASSTRVGFYHAGLSDKKRMDVHNDFLNDKINIVVATTAFGMGIDKPNIRHVVHWGAPKTLESYYQQTGRAGRDGISSFCTLIHRLYIYMYVS